MLQLYTKVKNAINESGFLAIPLPDIIAANNLLVLYPVPLPTVMASLTPPQTEEQQEYNPNPFVGFQKPFEKFCLGFLLCVLALIVIPGFVCSLMFFVALGWLESMARYPKPDGHKRVFACKIAAAMIIFAEVTHMWRGFVFG